MSTTRQVIRNSFWHGMELGVGIVCVMVSSIVVSRAFGPERLGYYAYFVWLTYMAGLLGTGGLQSTMLKFMTEFLSRGEPGTAYLIYRMAWRIQLVLSLAPLLIAIPLIWWLVPAESRWMAIFLVGSMAPRMLGFIPAQINSATLELNRNFPPAIASNLVTLGVILLAVKLDWGVTGLAISHPIGHTVDLIIKLFMTADHRNAWKRAMVPGAHLEPALRKRFIRFAASGIGLLLLGIIVADKSDIFLLRHLNPDIRQISFFSYSFTLVDKLLLLPHVLAGTLGLNLLAQQALGRARMAATAVSSCYYLLLIGLPVMLGAAAVAQPLWMIYGEKFAPAVPVFVIAVILALPRSFQWPAGTLLQATDEQEFILWTSIGCAIVNVGVDILLIPTYGAIGAAIGNGVGQLLGALVTWIFIKVKYNPDLMLGMVARATLSAVVMAGIAYGITLTLPPLPGAIAAILSGMIIYVGMLRLTRALRPEDRRRLESLTGALPLSLRNPANRLLWHMIPNAPATEARG